MFTKERKLEIIDKVYKHFIVEQKSFGYDSKQGTCVYGKEGDAARCAIGIFDHNNATSGHQAPVWGLPQSVVEGIFPNTSTTVVSGDLDFLTAVQNSHDQCAACGDRVRLSNKLAALKAKVLDEGI